MSLFHYSPPTLRSCNIWKDTDIVFRYIFQFQVWPKALRFHFLGIWLLLVSTRFDRWWNALASPLFWSLLCCWKLRHSRIYCCGETQQQRRRRTLNFLKQIVFNENGLRNTQKVLRPRTANYGHRASRVAQRGRWKSSLRANDVSCATWIAHFFPCFRDESRRAKQWP